MDEQGASAATDTTTRQLSKVACVGIGVAAAVLALLPWLITGMRLPLQNLWAEQTPPGDMPIALLPFSQYAVAEILSLIVVGYGAAGVVVRSLGPRLPRRGAAAVGAGVLTVHLVGTLQATATVASGLAERAASSLYLAALLTVVAAAVVTGLVVLRLVTAPPRAGAVVGLSVVALLGGGWLVALLAPPGTVPSDSVSAVLNPLVRWVPAVLVGAAIAWGGHGTRGRVAAALASLVLLWLVPAALTAVTSAAGSRVLLAYPLEMIDYGLEVLRAALLESGLVLPPLLVAVVVAAAGLALQRLLAHRRRPSR